MTAYILWRKQLFQIALGVYFLSHAHGEINVITIIASVANCQINPVSHEMAVILLVRLQENDVALSMIAFGMIK